MLACTGLRASATAATCSAAFRSHHGVVVSTPVLLARALTIDHGLYGGATQLYGKSSGEPNRRHDVHSDVGIAAALRELFVLSASTGPGKEVAAAVAATAQVAAAAATAVFVDEHDATAGGSGPSCSESVRQLVSILRSLPHSSDVLGRPSKCFPWMSVAHACLVAS